MKFKALKHKIVGWGAVFFNEEEAYIVSSSSPDLLHESIRDMEHLKSISKNNEESKFLKDLEEYDLIDVWLFDHDPLEVKVLEIN